MSAKLMIKRLNLKSGHVSRFITVGLESSIQISTYIYFRPNIITNDLEPELGYLIVSASLFLALD